jgi:hypothetical protein
MLQQDLAKAPKEYEESYEAWRRFNRIDGYQPVSMEELNPNFQLNHHLDHTFNHFNSDKIFGATRKNHFGMFPRSARLEDEIWVLFGGECPFVLRKTRRLGYGQLARQGHIHCITEG